MDVGLRFDNVDKGTARVLLHLADLYVVLQSTPSLSYFMLNMGCGSAGIIAAHGTLLFVALGNYCWEHPGCVLTYEMIRRTGSKGH
jgi:hypothetical protein